MKNIAILLGLVVSFAVVGCASKHAEQAPAASTTQTSAPAHHDYKGEIGGTK